jgi:hypothetical protein
MMHLPAGSDPPEPPHIGAAGVHGESAAESDDRQPAPNDWLCLLSESGIPDPLHLPGPWPTSPEPPLPPEPARPGPAVSSPTATPTVTAARQPAASSLPPAMQPAASSTAGAGAGAGWDGGGLRGRCRPPSLQGAGMVRLSGRRTVSRARHRMRVPRQSAACGRPPRAIACSSSCVLSGARPDIDRGSAQPSCFHLWAKLRDNSSYARRLHGARSNTTPAARALLCTAVMRCVAPAPRLTPLYIKPSWALRCFYSIRLMAV